MQKDFENVQTHSSAGKMLLTGKNIKKAASKRHAQAKKSVAIKPKILIIM